MQINYTMCQIEWKAASDGVVPPKALAAGKEGRDKLFLCRAWHDGEIVPGKEKRFDYINQQKLSTASFRKTQQKSQSLHCAFRW